MVGRARAEWALLVAELEECGDSIREFAARKGVNAKTLRWWRWRFRREAASVREPCSPATFVPVVVDDSVIAAEAAVPVVREVLVELPSGVFLRFDHALDEAGLRRLAGAFAGRA